MMNVTTEELLAEAQAMALHIRFLERRVAHLEEQALTATVTTTSSPAVPQADGQEQ